MAATHLGSLGVEVAWVSGPWFLSIFVNVLPWETGMFFLLSGESTRVLCRVSNLHGKLKTSYMWSQAFKCNVRK